MRSLLLVLALQICIVPAAHASSPHGGCHGGHAHGGHGGGHSHHSSGHIYHSYHGGRGGSVGGGGQSWLTDTRKGIVEIATQTGALSSEEAGDGATVTNATPVYSGAMRYYISNGLSRACLQVHKLSMA